MKTLQRIISEWPGAVTTAISVLVLAQATIAHFLDWPWFLPARGEKVETSVVTSVYLGVASVGAIYAGFAGVIIVFGLTPSSNLFRTFRIQAGDRMVSNWISIVSSAFVAAGTSLAAAFLEANGQRFLASFLFELGVLLLLHSSLRSIWVMRILLILVRADDTSAQQRDRTERLGRPFGSP
ncbi:hypothetical protein [Nocardia neocaledoniensis]|uniref:hypothetical protein n=1 Tax=Nocardia neocaledoniensis TaxID=236511 RepID=UPI0024546734|nr:hypothetical protein [Nocardia neocaledoniensis]